MTTRREFLGQVACALAVASLPCRIPAMVHERKDTDKPMTIEELYFMMCRHFRTLNN